MPATIIMGGQWGDEGKGKLTDALAGHADLVIRANGGSNAGHTVTTSAGVFKLHLVPSGILNPNCLCVVGAGVVVDAPSLVRELTALIERGIAIDNLVLSDRAHLVLPYHPIIDSLEEDAREEERIGTTRRGNGPAYADKVSRRGVRVANLRTPDSLRKAVSSAVNEHNEILTRFYGAPALDTEAVIRELEEAAKFLRPYIDSSETVVQDALAEGKQALIECAQAAMLDIDYGTYPYVTSSSPTAAGACQGAGIAPTQVDRIISVFKAYTTRVGGGPMPTELLDETGNLIRERGREYGTSTGRPRRTGWFDGPAARQSARLNGVTEINLSLLDVLDVMEEIKICTAYEIDGQRTTRVPSVVDELMAAKPVYETIRGWQTDLSGARSIGDLPEGARAYITALERIIGAPITMIGVGPAREQLVALSDNAATQQFASTR